MCKKNNHYSLDVPYSVSSYYKVVQYFCPISTYISWHKKSTSCVQLITGLQQGLHNNLIVKEQFGMHSSFDI